jgi:hypothetical protein
VARWLCKTLSGEGMEAIRNAYGVYKKAKFYIIVASIGFGSIILLLGFIISLLETKSNTETVTSTVDAFLYALMAWVGMAGATLPYFVWRESRATKKFFDWLEIEFNNLKRGANHPDGYTVSLDTPLVRYEVVFSAFLATTSFTSRPYVYNDRHSWFAQAMYTMYCLAFGWWFFGFEGIINTVKAISNNLSRKSSFTLRQLIEGVGDA